MPGGFSGRAPGGFSGRIPGGFSGLVCANTGTALDTTSTPSAAAIYAFFNIFLSPIRAASSLRDERELASPAIRVSKRGSAKMTLRQRVRIYDKETARLRKVDKRIYSHQRNVCCVGSEFAAAFTKTNFAFVMIW
jgi:hypothetical protein